MAVTREQLVEDFERPSLLRRLSWFDGAWALLLVLGSGYAYRLYHPYMDAYEVAIQAAATLALIAWGWYWKPVRGLTLAVAALSLFALWRYGGSLATAQTDFFLKYLLASQQAFMWMSALYVFATLAYTLMMFTGSAFVGRTATALTWSATAMGLAGLMVRWRESYLMGTDIGHIPVSNLYEVFILFAVITALLYLYHEGRAATRTMGTFVLLVISASVGFLLWYTFDREAYHIQPLVPALQSYWMKIHVPANFIGYGAFAFAAMLGVAAILAQPRPLAPERRRVVLPLAAAGFVVAGALLAAGLSAGDAGFGATLDAWAMLPATVALLFVVAACQGRLAAQLPAPALIDDMMYKAIALGFAAFTVATILGALWAAEAWGGYWSWDPKETWALIVWLNYAGWLHLRLTKGLRGTPMAWWAVIGLFVTAFAFLGVNMFLSGLHSYGTL
ncbi:cytochrome c-type biogenesis protein CcsB [Plasticicumulans lactativorans]|uniref:Cytochrome c-type biogenesis protein CcsB n=1 Tax=Plasticicumulans lactativorans TaxID=1133106 RepID=A0A4R2LAX2_9GAMM|nr:c-type cytochrome biogenesis protein CcsB [Plasticicumulans lactativorans]TCO82630.1 cytochrome c-type biogenesis protein CcsB [Plasticicumulans lactativorans]